MTGDASEDTSGDDGETGSVYTEPPIADVTAQLHASIVSESEVGCATFGLDEEAVAAIGGTTVSYGYDPLYAGHAQVLMIDTDETGGGFSYVSGDTVAYVTPPAATGRGAAWRSTDPSPPAPSP